MKPPLDAKPETETVWEKHRKATSGLLWGTWIMLFLTVVMGHETLQGFLDGQWVDSSSNDSGLLIPRWVTAVLTLGLSLFTLWCLRQYLTLKRTPPKNGFGNQAGSQ